MKRVLFTLLVVVFAACGCRQGGFFNGGWSDYQEYDMVNTAVDQYASDNGLSREEALEQLRARGETPGTGTPADGTAPAPAWSQQSGGPQ